MSKPKEEKVLLSIPEDSWVFLEGILENIKNSTGTKGVSGKEVSEALDKIKDALGIAETLEQFVDDIDVTGGVFENREGVVAPVVAIHWTDLGVTYMKACKALGRKPKIERCPGGDLVG